MVRRPEIATFPERPLRGWQGDGVALLNRLLVVADYTEPYYKDLTKMLLPLTLEAPGGPPRSSQAWLEQLRPGELRRRYAGRPEVDETTGCARAPPPPTTATAPSSPHWAAGSPGRRMTRR